MRMILKAAAFALMAAPALAGNEGFAPGNCTSAGRTMPTVTSILEFQRHLPTSGAIALQLAPAHMVGAIVEPSRNLRIKCTPRTTTQTGKDSAGGYLWMTTLTTNDTGLPDGWQPGTYILTEMSDYLTPEHYRTE